MILRIAQRSQRDILLLPLLFILDCVRLEAFQAHKHTLPQLPLMNVEVDLYTW